MKKAETLLFFSIFFLSCQHDPTKKNEIGAAMAILPTFESASWNPRILSAVDSFVDENNCEKCIYELYINKVLPEYTLISIKARSPKAAYMKKNRPLFMCKIKGKVFYVYSGLEDFLLGDNKKIIIDTSTNVIFYKNWTLIINNDSIKIKKDAGFPFFPSEDENPYSSGLHKPDSVRVR
jgi:hypothetical protein